MSIQYNTNQQIEWFMSNGIDHLDFAIRRPNGAFIYNNLQAISLKDANRLRGIIARLRGENCKRADIYCRPARGFDWPILMLDDVMDHKPVTGTYKSMAIHTSPEGGHQIWIATTTPLNEDGRRAAQEPLISQYKADAGSKSGEHFGRLAGFKNHKRNGNWVNYTTASNKPALDSKTTILPPRMGSNSGGAVVFQSPIRSGRRTGGVDKSASAREFGLVSGWLRKGENRQVVYNRLHAMASERKKSGDIDRYVNLTIANAEKRLSAQ